MHNKSGTVLASNMVCTHSIKHNGKKHKYYIVFNLNEILPIVLEKGEQTTFRAIKQKLHLQFMSPKLRTITFIIVVGGSKASFTVGDTKISKHRTTRQPFDKWSRGFIQCSSVNKTPNTRYHYDGDMFWVELKPHYSP